MKRNIPVIYIRADANPNVGMGHIMRCLSIADSLKVRGADIIFVLADKGGQSLIKDRGYNVRILDTPHDRMEVEEQVWEPEEGSIVIADSYFVSDRYLTYIKDKAGKKGKVVYMDDLGKHAFPTDILVNYNIYAEDLDYKGLYEKSGVDVPQLVLGTGYIPIREEFKGIPKKEQPKDVRDILVSTGGADINHVAYGIVKHLKTVNSKYRYHILVGGMNPDKESIREMADERILIHENVTDMKSLIMSCDMAISASGSTVYEISACGVPLVTYVMADNQIQGAAKLEKEGLALNLGDIRERQAPEIDLIEAAEELAKDHAKRCEIGEGMQRMVDGQGADRIAEIILL